MKRQYLTLTLAVLTLTGGILAAGAGHTAPPGIAGDAKGFDEVGVRLEANFTDGDAGVQFLVKGGDGLRSLQIVAPNRKAVLSLTSSDRPKLGIDEFSTESPEPDMTTALRSYPAGTYRFNGRTVDGDRLTATAVLSHALLPNPTITVPAQDSTGNPVTNLVVAWDPVASVARYVVELEQDVEGGAKLVTEVSAAQNTFAIPNGFLIPGQPYKVEIGSVALSGNISFTEHRFQTAM
ncbi:MAG: fibronectin type III domain-containing protein [Armatimonadetes bacterium]|nr:fibronectin type III domain-containing protein [Armatimonadota bacterium]